MSSEDASSETKPPDTNPSDPPSHAQDTGYTFTEDPWIRWRNTFRYLTGRLTKEGERQYRQGRDDRFEKADCERCEKKRDYLLQYSPIVRFLNQKISDLGGDLHEGNIKCLRCLDEQGGGMHPDYGILLCANRPEQLEDTLAHGNGSPPFFGTMTVSQSVNERKTDDVGVPCAEMVHAYDYLRFKADFRTHNLRHAACAEIRASSLSGECRFWREFWHRSQWKLMYQHQECVRRRATISVSKRPNCKDDVEAARAVNEVWDSCFADTRPFDEIYK